MNYRRSDCMPRRGVLLDVMEGDRFLCQIRYTKRGFPILVDGEVVESYDLNELKDFVYEKRPSFRNKKDIRIAFSNQIV